MLIASGDAPARIDAMAASCELECELECELFVLMLMLMFVLMSTSWTLSEIFNRLLWNKDGGGRGCLGGGRSSTSSNGN